MLEQKKPLHYDFSEILPPTDHGNRFWLTFHSYKPSLHPEKERRIVEATKYSSQIDRLHRQLIEISPSYALNSLLVSSQLEDFEWNEKLLDQVSFPELSPQSIKEMDDSFYHLFQRAIWFQRGWRAGRIEEEIEFSKRVEKVANPLLSLATQLSMGQDIPMTPFVNLCYPLVELAEVVEALQELDDQGIVSRQKLTSCTKRLFSQSEGFLDQARRVLLLGYVNPETSERVGFDPNTAYIASARGPGDVNILREEIERVRQRFGLNVEEILGGIDGYERFVATIARTRYPEEYREEFFDKERRKRFKIICRGYEVDPLFVVEYYSEEPKPKNTAKEDIIITEPQEFFAFVKDILGEELFTDVEIIGKTLKEDFYLNWYPIYFHTLRPRQLVYNRQKPLSLGLLAHEINHPIHHAQVLSEAGKRLPEVAFVFGGSNHPYFETKAVALERMWTDLWEEEKGIKGDYSGRERLLYTRGWVDVQLNWHGTPIEVVDEKLTQLGYEERERKAMISQACFSPGLFSIGYGKEAQLLYEKFKLLPTIEAKKEFIRFLSQEWSIPEAPIEMAFGIERFRPVFEAIQLNIEEREFGVSKADWEFDRLEAGGRELFLEHRPHYILLGGGLSGLVLEEYLPRLSAYSQDWQRKFNERLGGLIQQVEKLKPELSPLRRAKAEVFLSAARQMDELGCVEPQELPNGWGNPTTVVTDAVVAIVYHGRLTEMLVPGSLRKKIDDLPRALDEALARIDRPHPLLVKKALTDIQELRDCLEQSPQENVTALKAVAEFERALRRKPTLDPETPLIEREKYARMLELAGRVTVDEALKMIDEGTKPLIQEMGDDPFYPKNFLPRPLYLSDELGVDRQTVSRLLLRFAQYYQSLGIEIPVTLLELIQKGDIYGFLTYIDYMRSVIGTTFGGEGALLAPGMFTFSPVRAERPWSWDILHITTPSGKLSILDHPAPLLFHEFNHLPAAKRRSNNPFKIHLLMKDFPMLLFI